MTVMAIQSDRIGGRTVLLANIENINGDQNLVFEQPSTFGDCLLEAVRISTSVIATAQANLFELGPIVTIQHTAPLDFADMVGDRRWRIVLGTLAAPTAAQCIIEPVRPVLWRSGESLAITFVEVDTSAVPTADLGVTARVLRLRAP